MSQESDRTRLVVLTLSDFHLEQIVAELVRVIAEGEEDSWLKLGGLSTLDRLKLYSDELERRKNAQQE